MKTIDALLNLTKSGGFSWNPEKDEPTQGYMVSIYGREKILPPVRQSIEAYLSTYIVEMLDNDYYMGAWLENGKIVFDLSINIQDWKEAIQFAKANKQKAIYDINNGETIYLV